MSVFSNSVKSAIIDPVFTSATRCEFRLANRGEAYMPTMRIGNLGLSKAAQNNNEYHKGPGAAGVINRIQLLDGNEELDSLRNVGNWLTFKNCLRTNSQNDNVFNELMGGCLGWATGSTGELLSNDNKVVRAAVNGIPEPQTLGTLDLREVFPILNAVSHLSTTLFPNLRVVVEYHTDPRALVNNQTTGGVESLLKSVPILIVDEIVDEALIQSLDSQFTSAAWVGIEHDQVQVPQVPTITAAGAVTDEAVQSVNLRVNGFQDKAVSRIMISKVYQTLADYVDTPANGGTQMRALAQYGSRALHKEEFNVRLNGRNVLAGRGVADPAAATMLLADTWGELNMCPGMNIESVGLDSKYSLTSARRQNVALVPVGRPCANWVGTARTEPRVLSNGGILNAAGDDWETGDEPTAQQGYFTGNSAWYGLGLHDRVTDLQINYTRTGNPSTAGGTSASPGNYLPLDLHLFGEVAKRIDVSGGSWKISYA